MHCFLYPFAQALMYVVFHCAQTVRYGTLTAAARVRRRAQTRTSTSIRPPCFAIRSVSARTSYCCARPTPTRRSHTVRQFVFCMTSCDLQKSHAIRCCAFHINVTRRTPTEKASWLVSMSHTCNVTIHWKPYGKCAFHITSRDVHLSLPTRKKASWLVSMSHNVTIHCPKTWTP